jgi:hypothetical protein
LLLILHSHNITQAQVKQRPSSKTDEPAAAMGLQSKLRHGTPGCVKMRKTVIAGLIRNLLTCSFQILSLAFGDLRTTVSRIFTQADARFSIRSLSQFCQADWSQS